MLLLVMMLKMMILLSVQFYLTGTARWYVCAGFTDRSRQLYDKFIR